MLVTIRSTMAPIWALLFIGFYRVLGQKSLGCFSSSSSEPDLPSLMINRLSSPEECVTACRSHYYMYAGLMNGQQCYCGSHYGRNGPSNDCGIPCVKNKLLYCGSQKAMSIYATGQKGPSPPRHVEISLSESDFLQIIWQPPNIPNGNVTAYALRALAIDTHAYDPLPPIEIEVQGGDSNTTTLRSLHPGTKYNISVTASNLQGSSDPTFITGWTRIGLPDKPEVPKIVETTDKTVTIDIPEGSSENGPVTSYAVIVVQYGIVPPFDKDTLHKNYRDSISEGLGFYISAKFDAVDYNKYKRFVVGDGRSIGEFYNAPLDKRLGPPQIGIVIESRNHEDTQYSYSNLTGNVGQVVQPKKSHKNALAIALNAAIIFLTAMLLVLIGTFIILRRRYELGRMHRLPEQQELTLQGPLHEVDNMAYIPEDVPERTNHYQELKNKVWSIPRNFLYIEPNAIRRGRFGSIHTGSVQKDGFPTPVSVHSISDTSLRPSEKRLMLRELDICIRAGTMKYLAGLVGTCETPDTLYVALELPPRVLKDQLLAARTGKIFPLDQILPIGSAVAAALQHLESLKIVHGYVCARSVGIYNDWTPKLMGHGLAKYTLEDIKYARWTAAECFSNPKKTPKSVVWAFGVLLWEMLSMGGTPYANLEMDSDVETAVLEGVRLPQSVDTPDPVYEVLLSCWQPDPEERPTFDELVRLNTLTLCPITSINDSYLPELELN